MRDTEENSGVKQMNIVELADVHQDAFLAMVKDFEAGDPRGFSSLFKRKIPWSPAEFRTFLKECEKDRQDWRPKAGKTSITRYVLADSSGSLQSFGLLRFPLNEELEINGGNLLCAVPPSLRGRGFGSYCLSRLLFEAVRAGLRRALVTCLSKDAAARRVIEKNRGQLFDTVKFEGEEISRFWIDFRG
jgi:predicted acetyltransferase